MKTLFFILTILLVQQTLIVQADSFEIRIPDTMNSTALTLEQINEKVNETCNGKPKDASQARSPEQVNTVIMDIYKPNDSKYFNDWISF